MTASGVLHLDANPCKGIDSRKDEGFALRSGVLGRALAILSHSPLVSRIKFSLLSQKSQILPSHFSPQSVNHHPEDAVGAWEQLSPAALHTKPGPSSVFPTQGCSTETALTQSLNKDLDIFLLRKCQFPEYLQDHYSLWNSKGNLIFGL